MFTNRLVSALLTRLFVVNYVLGCNCLYHFPYGLHNPLGLRPVLPWVQAESPQSFPGTLSYSKSYTPGAFLVLTYTKAYITQFSHYSSTPNPYPWAFPLSSLNCVVRVQLEGYLPSPPQLPRWVFPGAECSFPVAGERLCFQGRVLALITTLWMSVQQLPGMGAGDLES